MNQPSKSRVLDGVTNLLQEVSDSSTQLARQISSRHREHMPLGLWFGVTPEPSIDARARVRLSASGVPQAYRIEISSGLVMNLHILTHALLSRGDVMPDLGPADLAFDRDPECQLRDVDWGGDLLDQIELLRNERRLLWRIPGQRATAAAAILQLAVTFAFWHELGHIQRGHLQWCTRRRGGDLYFEAAGRDIVIATAISFQALELAADSHGGLGLAAVLSGCEDIPTVARWCGFAIGMMFQTFDFMGRSLNAHLAATHRHPGLRMLYVASGLIPRARKYGLDLPVDAEEFVERGLREACAACDKLGIGHALSPIRRENDRLLDETTRLLDHLDLLVVNEKIDWAWR